MGVLGGPLDVQRGQGGPGVDWRGPGWIEGVPGRFLIGPGGLLEKVIFSFWGDGFVNSLMKY